MLIKKDLPRLAPNKPEYPTDDQMATLFNAWKKGGKKALGETLDKMHPRTQETPKP